MEEIGITLMVVEEVFQQQTLIDMQLWFKEVGKADTEKTQKIIEHEFITHIKIFLIGILSYKYKKIILIILNFAIVQIGYSRCKTE